MVSVSPNYSGKMNTKLIMKRLNYLALFILSSFTIDKARFLQHSNKKKKNQQQCLRATIFSPSLDLSQMKLNQTMAASDQHQPREKLAMAWRVWGVGEDSLD